jgi:hypothetical protein
MSRSYKRRPFMAICGNGSAKQDKVLAHRGERRAVQRAIHNARKQDFEDFICPLRRECCHNNTYDWGRDGKQTYQRPRTIGHDGIEYQYKDWFVRMMRK